jgi:uncharacterized protein (TIGR00156 family)
MKKYTEGNLRLARPGSVRVTALFVCCLLVSFSAATLYAQQGFTGPAQTGFTGQAAGQFTTVGMQGFTGPVAAVTVAQVQTFTNKVPAVLQGNIVAHLGGDRYLFRDSSGEIIIKIKHDRWWGLTVGVSDLVQLGGELKRDKKTGWINYFDAKSIRRA